MLDESYIPNTARALLSLCIDVLAQWLDATTPHGSPALADTTA